MYFIGIKDGKHFLGNAGTMKTSFKSESMRDHIAELFAAQYGHTEVYLIESYTQKMCEMDNDEFVEHVRRNGKRYR